jgi:hypothetical protein
MNSQYQMTLDSLVKDELDGKSAAIGLYDDMLWKIRTGYAVLLYGAVGIIAGLVNEQIVVLGKPTGLASSTIILGFSVFGALMDYSFMRSKLRVVDYRDRLLELSYHKATSGAWPLDGDKVLDCLKNSGERNTQIDWSKRTGRTTPLIYYGGTCLFCIIAIGFLAPILPW